MIEPLIAAGMMPTLAALRERSAWGNLATLQPALSPMLWTSIATGKRPTKHGVLGFVEATPDGSGIRPIASSTRRVKALWNILAQAGLRSNVVGWYATAPAERIPGTMVAEGFERPVGPLDAPWTFAEDAVHPPALAAELAALRVHPQELDASALLPFVPRAAEIDQAQDPRLAHLARMLAQTVSIQSIATHLITATEWDFTAVYFEGIDRFGHEFMPLRAPTLAGVPPRDVELYGEVMNGCYRFHDMMLERLLELAGPETTVLLVSDHGYHHAERRPARDAGPLDSHRHFGIALAAGPGISPGERIYGGNVLDVAPTILALFGLPAGRDMDGRPWGEILRQPAPPSIASWETVAGEDGRDRGSAAEIDPAAAAEAIRQLVALGYLDEPSTDGREAARLATEQAQWNLALAHLDAGEAREAVPLLRELHQRHPEDRGLQLQLAIACAAADDAAEAARLATPLAEGPSAMPRAWLLLSRLALADDRTAEAAAWLRRVEEATPDDPALLVRTGQFHLQTRNFEGARRVFARAIEADAESAFALDGLAAALLGLSRPAEALESALQATELLHFLPRAHFHIGEALCALHEFGPARTALELCLRQAPSHVEARELLATVLRRLGRKDDASREAANARFLRQQARLRDGVKR